MYKPQMLVSNSKAMLTNYAINTLKKSYYKTKFTNNCTLMLFECT